MRAHRAGRLAVAGLAVLVVAGCSSGGSKSAAGSSAPSKPTAGSTTASVTATESGDVQCSALLGKPASAWLPVARGDGCMQGGEIEPAYVVHCKDGSDLLDFGNGPTYFGLSTGTLAVSQQDISRSSGAYGELYQHCTA